MLEAGQSLGINQAAKRHGPKHIRNNARHHASERRPREVQPGASGHFYAKRVLDGLDVDRPRINRLRPLDDDCPKGRTSENKYAGYNGAGSG